MSGIEKTPAAPHPHLRQLARQTAHWLAARGMLAADVVVLVPYAQLMPLAREAWIAEVASGQACLLPRFLSTQQWAGDMEALHPQWGGACGWLPKASLAHAQARRMLGQTGLDKVLGGTVTPVLIETLVQAAQSLVPRVQAMHPAEREAWLADMRRQRVWGFEARAFDADAAEQSPQDALEPALLHIALEWLGMTRFDTDVLWEPAVHDTTPALVVWQGLQTEGLAHALARHWGEAALLLAWPVQHTALAVQAQRFVRYQPRDEQQEAQWATASVLRLLQQGLTHIGVVALDRALLRRMHAMLSAQGVSVHDTTGWRLSTTHAATQLVAWLEAVRYGASTHEVLDALAMVGAGELDSARLHALEQWLIRTRHCEWPSASFFEHSLGEEALAETALRIEAWRRSLQKPRSLLQWLQDLRTTGAEMGWQALLENDRAGQAVLAALHMDEPQVLAASYIDLARERFDLAAFTAWVRAALEAESFIPQPPAFVDAPQVKLIPLSQVLGCAWDALVLPGCDEAHLPWCPVDSSPWTRSQREKLGLPTEEARSDAQGQAWRQALAAERVLVFSRKHNAGEQVSPSPLLRQSLHQLQTQGVAWPEAQLSPMDRQVLAVQAVAEPAPVWQEAQLQAGGLLQRLSPSAYEDLRRCPYRFHARRLLGLTPEDELSEEADKRDWGDWVHRVLHRFHAGRSGPAGSGEAGEPCVSAAEQLDDAARWVEQQMRLDGASFVPFRAAWPALRDAYVQWLASHEASGHVFVQGELDANAILPEARVQLLGRLDRVDRTAHGQTLILDYKTESEDKTRNRVRDAQEDTQLAFYALLMEPRMQGSIEASHLQAAYLNLGESGKTTRGQRELPGIKLHGLSDLASCARALREGIASDVQRLRQGHVLQALGDGLVCDHCEARGLCRRDFWRGHEAA
jgi:ATP-dependent helicase/nuclease subunit B